MIREVTIRNMVCPACGSVLYVSTGGYIFCDNESCTHWKLTA